MTDGPIDCPHADSREGCRCDCVQCVGQTGRTGWHSEGGLARSVAIHELGHPLPDPEPIGTLAKPPACLNDPSGG